MCILDYAVDVRSLCSSARPSHSGVVPKRSQISSTSFHNLVFPPFYFSGTNCFYETRRGNPQRVLKYMWNLLLLMLLWTCTTDTCYQKLSIEFFWPQPCLTAFIPHYAFYIVQGYTKSLSCKFWQTPISSEKIKNTQFHFVCSTTNFR